MSSAPIIVIWKTLATIWLLIVGITASAQDSIRIGAILCLSGECAEWGDNALKGAQLAVAEVNNARADKRPRIDLVIEDSREMSPEEAIVAFRKLRADKRIPFILGPSWTPAGLILGPLAVQARVVLATPSISVRDFSRNGPYLFNFMPPEDIMIEQLARLAIDHGWRRGAIFGSQQPADSKLARVFASMFVRLGGIIVIEEFPLPEASDLSTEALRLRASNPDFVFVSNWGGSAPKALRKIGYSRVILTRQIDQQRLQSAGGSFEGAVFPHFPSANREFDEKFVLAYGAKPSLTAAVAYDAIKVYCDIADQGAGSSDVIADTLSKVNYSGVSGTVKFDQDRNIQSRHVEFAQVVAGKFTEYK